MRLSERDRRILFYAQFYQDDNIDGLKALAHSQTHSIRYCLNQARVRGLAEQRRFINFCRLGFTPYALYFSLSGQSATEVAAILATLMESPSVSWVGELGGDYQFGLCYNARCSSDVLKFIDEISLRHGQVFSDKALAARLQLKFFGNKYLYPTASERWELGYQVSADTEQIDELDHRILQAFGNSHPRSQRALAQTLAVPASTIDYRTKKLKERGLLLETYLQFNPQLLGMQSFLLLVAVKGSTPDSRALFFEFCKRHPNIVLLIHALGNWDFELAVDVASARDIITITQQVREQLGTAIDFLKVLPLFRYAKVSEYPFE